MMAMRFRAQRPSVRSAISGCAGFASIARGGDSCIDARRPAHARSGGEARRSRSSRIRWPPQPLTRQMAPYGTSGRVRARHG